MELDRSNFSCFWVWAHTFFFRYAAATYPVFPLLFLGLTFIFGIGSHWVSKNIYKNHDIVRLGIIAKVFAFAAFLWAWVDGQIPFILIGGGLIDLLFAVLYVEFLLYFRKSEHTYE